jgi:hypothetical protein
VTKALATIPANDALMAKQLSAQYQNAIGGLWQVVKFGAMMLMLRDKLVLSARGQNSPLRGPGSTENSLGTWITENCPEINRATAYRFMAIADGLKNEFKLGVKVDLYQLLEATPTALDAKSLKTRNAIEAFLEGKSQRQLLFSFAREDQVRRGGLRIPGEDLTPEEEIKRRTERAREEWGHTLKELEIMGVKEESWAMLNKSEQEAILGVLEKVAKRIRQHHRG